MLWNKVNLNNKQNKMNIKIRRIDNGLQQINRLSFKGDIGKEVYIDLWDNEMKELKTQIENLFTEVIE